MTVNKEQTLAEKIIAAAIEAGPVTQDGRNDFSRYNYTTDAQVSAVSHTLLKHGVMVLPQLAITDTWKDGKNNYVKIEGKFILTDGKEQLEGRADGVGADTLDKAAYKAETGAKKNFLMQLLLLSTGTDTDDDQGKGIAQSNQKKSSSSQRQTETKQKLMKVYQELKKAVGEPKAKERYIQAGKTAGIKDKSKPTDDQQRQMVHELNIDLMEVKDKKRQLETNE